MAALHRCDKFYLHEFRFFPWWYRLGDGTGFCLGWLWLSFTFKTLTEEDYARASRRSLREYHRKEAIEGPIRRAAHEAHLAEYRKKQEEYWRTDY